ncbi:MAG: putative kinase [Phycisphaerales bacterium]|nr:putative kinase [Phycisphaerales bacterium]
MAASGLEQTLRNLSRVGTLVKDRGYRQIWRFEHEGRAYYLKFYPKTGPRDRFRRFFRGSPAMAEFTRLQWLQKAQIPAPRAVAAMMGFNLNGTVGDAVVLEAIEPSVQLDEYFSRYELRGERAPDHLKIAGQIRDLVRQLARAGLGHEDLHLGNFLLQDGRLYLLDGYAVRKGGLTLAHLRHLGHSVSRYATRTDFLRGWEALGPGGRLPLYNPLTNTLAGTFLRRRATGENRYFGRIESDGWRGAFFKQDKYPRRWSTASGLQVTREDWERELPRLLRQIDEGKLKVIKTSKSGDVIAGSVTVGGREVEVIIKRPRRRYWYRYLNEIGRGPRSRRAWFKAWKLILRNLPTAWPLLFVERRTMGYVTDNLIIFERVPGPTLARVDLDSLPARQRDMLFRRAGRILREIERQGFAHFDAKASNWIVRPDEKLGPMPVLIDVDGIRQRRWIALGIRRLLRSVQENSQYSVPDSLALCQGYAPTARYFREGDEDAGEPAALQEPGERQDDSASDGTAPAPAHEKDLHPSKTQ